MFMTHSGERVVFELISITLIVVLSFIASIMAVRSLSLKQFDLMKST